MKKKLISIILTVTTLATFAGCANNAVSQPESGSSVNSGSVTEDTSKKDEPDELFHLTQIAQNTGVAHGDSMVAHASGLYEKEGLDVDMTYVQANADSIQAVLTGKALVGSTSATTTLQYIDQGSDLVIIGGQMTEGASVFCQPDRLDEFKDLTEEELAGKKVGVSRLQTGDVAFRQALTERGVDISKIEFVELDSAATVLEAIQNGQVDLGILMVTFRQAAEQQGLSVVTHIGDLWPGHICCRVFVTRDTLENNRDELVKLLKANIEAYALIQTDEDAAVEYMTQEIAIDEGVVREQVYDYGHLTLDPNPSIADTTKFYESMVNIGYAGGNVNIADHIDVSLYEEALAELLEEDPANAVYLQLKADAERTNH